jgi:hypothetical protein
MNEIDKQIRTLSLKNTLYYKLNLYLYNTPEFNFLYSILHLLPQKYTQPHDSIFCDDCKQYAKEVSTCEFTRSLFCIIYNYNNEELMIELLFFLNFDVDRKIKNTNLNAITFKHGLISIEDTSRY